jgi:hypothetical protein
VNPEKSDWGSLSKAGAEKGMANAETITVPTTTLPDLFQEFGCPYYLKCDIEGGDRIVLDQLVHGSQRPEWVSFEVNGVDDFDMLRSAGYDVAQLVNQYLHFAVIPPNPPKEGNYVDARFDGHCTGLFGNELPEARWCSIDEAQERYRMWNALRLRDPDLGVGWLDVHARRRQTAT